MIKVILRMECGVGTDTADAYLVDPAEWAKYNDPSTPHGEDVLADGCWQEALQHAESYGIYPESSKPEEFDEDDDGGDNYTDDISGWLELYNPEEHDGLKCGGGDWKWDRVL